ncbi:MAG TPA: hypothetical protein VFQ41_19615 [Candidatus Angelobacter sp.]|nr:hypothetical protein [Candidatus Angelobacter sp.]
MAEMEVQGSQGGMPPLSMPWLSTAILTHITLLLMAGLAAWEEKAGQVEVEAVAVEVAMGVMVLPVAAKLAMVVTLGSEAWAGQVEMEAMAAPEETEETERQLRFRCRSTAT